MLIFVVSTIIYTWKLSLLLEMNSGSLIYPGSFFSRFFICLDVNTQKNNWNIPELTLFCWLSMVNTLKSKAEQGSGPPKFRHSPHPIAAQVYIFMYVL